MSLKKKLIAGGGSASGTTVDDGLANFTSHTLVFPDDTNTAFPADINSTQGTNFLPSYFNLPGSHSTQEEISSNLPANPNIYCFTIGSNNRLILSHSVGGGNICYSDDNGNSFTVSTLTDGSSIPNYSYYSIVAHGGTVIAVGGGSIYRSTDNGVTFAYVTGSGGRAVGTDGNGTWIATSGAAGYFRSTDDGATWTSVTFNAISITSAASVAYSDGMWIIGAQNTSSNTAFLYSTDGGLSFTQSNTSGSGSNPTAIAHNGDGVFIASTVEYIWYSNDGINWNTIINTSGRVNNSLSYNNGKFWALAWDGYNNRIYEISSGNYDGSWTTSGNVVKYKLPDVINGTISGCIASDNYIFYGGGSKLYRKVITSVEAGTASDCLVMYKNLSANGQEYYLDTKRGTRWRWDVGGSPAHQNNSNSTLDYVNFRSDGIQVGSSIGTFTTASNQMTNWKIFRVKEGFFDIVTWTGDGTSDRQIAHNLNAPVGMMAIFKLSGSSSDVPVYHQWLANNTLAGVTNGAVHWNNQATITQTGSYWGSNNTSFTDTHFYVGSTNTTYNSAVNESGSDYIAYIWANNPSQGIKCDAWLGTGVNSWSPPQLSATNFVDLDFQPEFIWHRQPQSNTPSKMNDLANGGVYGYLSPLNQVYSAASTRADGCVMTESGVYRTGAVSGFNTTGNESVYMAIKKNMPTVSTGDDLLGIHTYSGNGSLDRELNDNYLGGDPYPDANPKGDTRIFTRGDTDGQNGRLFDRTMGYGSIDLSGGTITYNIGHMDSNGYGTLDMRIENSVDMNNFGKSEVIYTFKNAKEAFENFVYYSYGYQYLTGERAIPHNLESTPEFIWIKPHDMPDMLFYHKDLGINEYAYLANAAPTAGSWFTQVPDASNVYIDCPTSANSTTSYVSKNAGMPHHIWMWSTLEGITKVGSYVGTGTALDDTLDIDCGFSAGSKMVIILDKRTGSGYTPRWWHTSEGHQFSGGQRVLRDLGSSLYNTNAGTNSHINLSINSSGFRVTNSANTTSVNLNVSGETYHYFAVAA